MKKTFNYLAITSCFVLGTTFAHADSSQGKMKDEMFKAMDTNSDRMITRDEFNTFGTKKFQEMDVNGNGQISSEEMNAWRKKMNSGGRNKMDDKDTDTSGKARSQKEYNAYQMDDTKTDGRSNNSWTPNSGTNRSGNMGNAWDKKRDDAQNKKIDNDDDDNDDND